jgi:hypothetical protein
LAVDIGGPGYHEAWLIGAAIPDRVELDASAEGAETMSMTEEMFRVVLETANAKSDKDGWTTLPEGRLMTLYVAHHGVQLTVGKVDAVRSSSGIIKARTSKGDTFLLALEDIFATGLDGGTEASAARKAGFLG